MLSLQRLRHFLPMKSTISPSLPILYRILKSIPFSVIIFSVIHQPSGAKRPRKPPAGLWEIAHSFSVSVLFFFISLRVSLAGSRSPVLFPLHLRLENLIRQYLARILTCEYNPCEITTMRAEQSWDHTNGLHFLFLSINRRRLWSLYWERINGTCWKLTLINEFLPLTDHCFGSSWNICHLHSHLSGLKDSRYRSAIEARAPLAECGKWLT